MLQTACNLRIRDLFVCWASLVGVASIADAHAKCALSAIYALPS